MFALVIGIVVLVYVVAALIGLVGVIVGGVFAVLGTFVSAVFTSGRFLPGVLLGLVAFLIWRRRERA